MTLDPSIYSLVHIDADENDGDNEGENNNESNIHLLVLFISQTFRKIISISYLGFAQCYTNNT